MSQPITLTITLDQENGGVSCNGPLQDKVLCYGLLEGAKDAIRGWHIEQEKPAIAPASDADVLKLTGRKR